MLELLNVGIDSKVILKGIILLVSKYICPFPTLSVLQSRMEFDALWDENTNKVAPFFFPEMHHFEDQQYTLFN